MPPDLASCPPPSPRSGSGSSTAWRREARPTTSRWRSSCTGPLDRAALGAGGRRGPPPPRGAPHHLRARPADGASSSWRRPGGRAGAARDRPPRPAGGGARGAEAARASPPRPRRAVRPRRAGRSSAPPSSPRRRTAHVGARHGPPHRRRRLVARHPPRGARGALHAGPATARAGPRRSPSSPCSTPTSPSGSASWLTGEVLAEQLAYWPRGPRRGAARPRAARRPAARRRCRASAARPGLGASPADLVAAPRPRRSGGRRDPLHDPPRRLRGAPPRLSGAGDLAVGPPVAGRPPDGARGG